MGTPEFAVASLDALINEGFNVVGVVTAPDKPAGRGMKLQESAVKKYCVEKGLNILQPQKLKNPQFLKELESLNADLQIVVAFRMLPEMVWNMPPMGTINVHASILPHYRGAAPINWTIINGEKETGVTTFKLKHEIDTGNVLLQEKVQIGENETAGELHDKLKLLGARLLAKTVIKLADGTITEKAQDTDFTGVSYSKSSLKHAPKIFTDTCRIDWNNTADNIHNLIRGLSPYPGAFTHLNNKNFKIYKVEKGHDETIPVGNVKTDNKTYLKIGCTDGYINVLDVQLEGKRRMPIQDLLRGYKMENPSVGGAS